VRIPAKLYRQAIDHATFCLPEEACGLVGGLDGVAAWITPITNQLHSPVRFRMDPSEQLRAFQSLEAQSIELIAIFHSHPQGPPNPSATDVREFNYPGVLTLIISPIQGDWQMRAFWIQADRVSEEPIEIIDIN
jgi:proteasome lid subunit RPN8/RPN11